MKRSCILLPVIFTILCVRTVLAAAPPLGILEPEEASTAQSSGSTNLFRFKTSITAENYAFFGFHSPHEVPQATNDQPLLIYTVPLGQLRNYHPGDDFRDLLKRSSRVIIPVVINREVRSSVTFRIIDPLNMTVSDVRLGQRRLIRDLMVVRESIPNVEINPPNVPFVVEIPVFDIWLIGYVDKQDQVVLLATIDLPLGSMTIPAGERITELAMFQLTAKAQDYNGLPN